MDSSSEDEGGYTTTDVTLGYASKEATGDAISHIGGYPTWLDGNVHPPAALAKCKACNGLTSLLLQLNADLQSHFPNDERRLHVFCCRKKACSKKIGSVRAFREVRKPATRSKPAASVPSTENQKPDVGLGTTLFGGSGPASSAGNTNPFSAPKANPAQQPNPFSSLPLTSSLAAIPPQTPADEPQPPTTTFADKLKISDQKPEQSTQQQEPWPNHDSFPAPFTTYHLDAGGEELESDQLSPTKTAGPPKTQYDTDDGPNALEKDSFESSLDKTFQKFSDRIAQNPEQVLRYEFKGQPLLYSGTDNVATRFIVPHGKVGSARGIPRCDNCGAQRVFEVQLVPGLIYELEKDEAMDLDDGMEWGTIVVGTCANNCGESGAISFREEWVGVQWEERVPKK